MIKIHCVKSVRIWSFFWSAFWNAGKYGPEKLRIRTFSRSDHDATSSQKSLDILNIINSCFSIDNDKNIEKNLQINTAIIFTISTLRYI